MLAGAGDVAWPDELLGLESLGDQYVGPEGLDDDHGAGPGSPGNGDKTR